MLKRVVTTIVTGYFLVGIVGCSCSRPNPPPEKIPGLYIEAASVAEGQSGTQQLRFKVTLSPVRSSAISVDYELLPNTSITPSEGKDLATPDVDYVSLPKGSVTFAPNEAEKFIVVEVKGDTLYEHDELVKMHLSNAVGAEIIESDAEGTLQNDDAAPVAKIELLETDATARAMAEKSTGDVRHIKLSLDVVSGLDATVQIEWSLGETSAASDTALANIDYVVDSSIANKRINTITIPAGETTREFSIETVDDAKVEPQETFFVDLKRSAGNVDVTIKSDADRIDFTLDDNDIDRTLFSKPLNDTGIDYVLGGGYTSVVSELDGSKGRDYLAKQSSLTKVGGGIAGFDFTKLDANGQALTDQTKTYDQIPWACVRDNRTGLVWETKSKDSSSFYAVAPAHGFYWYDPEATTNGGDAGLEGDSVDCVSGASCNTAYYAARVNVRKLCGMTGWRLPTLEELRGIANYANASTTVNAFDENYFTHFTSIASYYSIWSSNTVTTDPTRAWAMIYSQSPTVDQVRKTLQSETAVPMLVNDQLITH